jgi:hypothetical protein
MAHSSRRSVNVAAWPRAWRSTRLYAKQKYAKQKLSCVEQKRSHAPTAAEIGRLPTEMQSPDEHVRAKAVRQVCPCRLPWEVFTEIRPEAKCLRHDPSPLVRAQARHVEEDARELAALEALQNWTEERDEDIGAKAHRSRRRGRRRLNARAHAGGECVLGQV